MISPSHYDQLMEELQQLRTENERLTKEYEQLHTEMIRWTAHAPPTFEALYVKAAKENEQLREAAREAVAAYGHHYNTEAQGLSVFIRENGRHGSSPWNEWCESMKQLTDAIGETT